MPDPPACGYGCMLVSGLTGGDTRRNGRDMRRSGRGIRGNVRDVRGNVRDVRGHAALRYMDLSRRRWPPPAADRTGAGCCG